MRSRRSTSKMTAIDQPSYGAPFIAAIGSRSCQRSTRPTSAQPSVDGSGKIRWWLGKRPCSIVLPKPPGLESC